MSGCVVAEQQPRLCPNGWVIFDFTAPDGSTEWYVTAEPGKCTRAATERNDIRFFSDDTCSDSRTCAIVMPGESLVVASPQVPSGTLGQFDERALRSDGSCPLECD